MTESHQLLAEYAASGSEAAFRELVRRYINLVYSTALRLVGGDTHQAEDVAQTVFIDLARKAAGLSPGVMLGGWLHRDTCFVASKLRRQEHRRQVREQQAALMDASTDPSQAHLEQVSAMLDEAINGLGEEERTAILLRFFEQRDFRSVGAALNSSEDAARMRVSRALDKLQGMLKRRGVTLSMSALAAGLASEAVTAAPTGLAASVAGAALGAAVGTGAAATTMVKILSMTKLKLLVGAVLVAGGVGIPLAVQHRNQVQLQEQNRQLRQQVQDLASANEALSNRLAQAAAQAPTDTGPQAELLRLRGEVGTLRAQLADAKKAAVQPAPTPAPENKEPPERQRQKQMGIAKMNYAKAWVMAFTLYAQKNQQYPTNFSQALPFWPPDLKFSVSENEQVPLVPDESTTGTSQYGLVPTNYDITYQGSITTLTNPQSIIVLREKDAWPTTTSDGQTRWARAYGFADGHSEIHISLDGNFLPWEQQHMVAASGNSGASQ